MNIVMVSTMSRRVRIVLGAGLALAIMLSGTPHGGVNRWTTGGPYGGEIEVLVVDPQTPNVLFASVAYSGFFKSQNWGASWTVIPGLTTIMGCIIHPLDHQLILASNGHSPWRSTDGGASWQSVYPGFGLGWDFAIDLHFPDIVYATGLHSVSRSTDRGLTWTLMSDLGTIQVENISMEAGTSNIVYVATWDDGILKSTNGGSSWTTVFQHPSEPYPPYGYKVECHPAYPGRLYASASYPAGFYVSMDGGAHWSRKHEWMYFFQLVFDPFDLDTMYAANFGGIYKTSDGGTNWIQLQDALSWCVAIDPLDPSRILYDGSLHGVLRSWDGGATWQMASFGLMDNVTAIAVSPTTPGTLYIGDRTDNFYKSSDGGASWRLLRSQGGSISVNALTATTAPGPLTLLAGVNGNVYRSQNEWASWTTPLMDKYIFDLKTDPLDDRNVYATSGWPYNTTYDFFGIFKSSDGGGSWVETHQLAHHNLHRLAIDPVTPQVLYAGGDGGLFRTTNAGVSWDSSTTGLTDPTVRSVTVDPGNHARVYVGTDNSGVFRSTNTGASWAPTGMTTGEGRALAVDAAASRVYAGTRDGLFFSSNAGTSWQNASPLITQYVNDLAVDSRSPRRVYAATAGGVFSLTTTTKPTVAVSARFNQPGNVNPSLPSQILSSSAVTFLLAPTTFPGAGATTPVVLEITLPPGALLSQTLADGIRVVPLAVSEYAFNTNTGLYEPLTGVGSTGGIPGNAVQLEEAVAGTDRIRIRLSQSTSGWVPSTPDNLLGFTVGVGAGVWPPNTGSNWSTSGLESQSNTQFFVDLRGYDFAANNGGFPLTVRCYQLPGWQLLDVDVAPNPINLFQKDLSLAGELSMNLQLGADVRDFVAADLNGDGREDTVSIDNRQKRLYWTLRQPDGTYNDMQWRDLAGDAPVTVEIADATGDGRPDVLVTDTGKHLTVYAWETLFAKTAEQARELIPAMQVALAGEVTDSLMLDVDMDGWKDFMYVDTASNLLTILYGKGFTKTVQIMTAPGPRTLAGGDFNGDGWPDVAVAYPEYYGIQTFINNGDTLVLKGTYTGSGKPTDIAAGEVNRDGRAELAVALRGSKTMTLLKMHADGSPESQPAQTIHFPNEPSTVQVGNFDGQNGDDVLLGFSDYHRLAMCISDDTGRLTYAYSINTLGDMELDPVNHVTLTENNILSVAGGTAYGGVCSRAGVAALADQPFNLIHLPRSQNLSFSVINLDSQSAMLNLELYDDSGQFRQAVTPLVDPGQQFARYLTDPTLFGAAAANSQRWVRGFVTQADTYGFWLANDGSTLNYLDGLPLADIRTARSHFLLPAGIDPLRQVLLLNPSQDQARVTVQRLGGGSVQQTLAFVLAGRARRVLDLGTAMPALAAEDYLLVSADRPILGCQLWGDTQKLAALDGLPVPEAPATLYCPHIASGSLGVYYQTWLTLINPTDQGTQAYLWLYGDNGQLLGSAPPQTVPAHSKLHQNFATLFGVSQAVTGYLLVEVSGPGAVTGAVTFGEAGAGRFLSSLPLSAVGAADYLVGHIANGTLGPYAFFTGLAVLNPHTTAHSVRVSAFNQTGQLIGATTDSIPARGREVFLLDQKIPGLSSIFGGYLRIEDLTDPAAQLRVFALFGDQPLNFLSAVAAQPVRE